MDLQKDEITIGDNMSDARTSTLYTCPTCGGRGGGYDSEGNWYECDGGCHGTGQIDD
jgi:predicted RNA-binding Zn-ribbon protein involved in translation (DUF1610 family)